MNRRLLSLLTSAVVLLCSQSGAREAASTTRDYRLNGPFMYEASRRAAGLQVADLNGDGLLDFSVVSNDEGLLIVYYQEEAEDSLEPFRKEEITLDRLVQSTVAADVNGDGRMDLVLCSSTRPLSVMYQNEEGRLQKGRDTDLEADYANLGDLTGDGRDDLLISKGKELKILPGKARGVSLEPEATFYTVGQIGGPAIISDVDGDGQNDIFYHPTDKRDHLVIRLQSEEGAFPAEFHLESGLLRAADGVPLKGKASAIAAIHGQTRHLVLLRLGEPVETEEEPGELIVSEHRIIGFAPETWDDRSFSTVADFDGDGRRDLLVALPGSAQVRLVRQTRAGGLKPSVSSCLEGVRQILAWPAGEGEPEPIVMLSPDEKAVGVAVFDEDSEELPFPRILELGGDPLAMAVEDLDGSGETQLIVVEKRAEEPIRIAAYREFNPREATLAEARSLIELEDLRDDPNGMSVVDPDRDGLMDIVLFFEYDSPVVIRQRSKGQFEKREGTSGFVEGLFQDIDARRLFPAQLYDDEGEELLAVKESYVRAFHLDQSGRLVVSQQFDGMNTRSRLKAATVSSLRRSDSRDVALLDSGNRVLTVYGQKPDSSYELVRQIDLDEATYESLESLDLNGDGLDDLILIAPDRITVIYTMAMEGNLETLDSYETEVEDGGYGFVKYLGNDRRGTPVIACLEMKENVLEFFDVVRAGEETPGIERFYRFKVFDSESSVARRVNLDAPPEPRDLVQADLNEDGKQDLLALVHDYVIVYYQD